MKKVFSKIKGFFQKIFPTKRRLIQVYAMLLYNANLAGFVTGKIFEGDSKSVCVPGFNCYSCPGAIGACPLGSIQNALAGSKTKYPTYVIGIILLYCILLGRTICGYLCPVGFIQELLYKIKTPKLQKSKVTRILSYFKYVLLVVLVIIIPLMYGLQQISGTVPAFCKYICPVGTFEGGILLLSNPNNKDLLGMLGSLFTWKFVLLVVFVVASIFIFRFFCRFLCPLGALYGLFNKLSIIGIKVDKSKCNSCQACINFCKMDVKEVGDHECINCGECRNVCHCDAISWKTIEKLIKEDEVVENEVISESINEENEEVIENVKPKTKISKRKIFNWVSTILALGLLIFMIIYANFIAVDKQFIPGDIVDDLVVQIYDNKSYDIEIDDKHTLIYFYDVYDENVINHLNNFAGEEINILAISSYDNYENNGKLINKDLDIIYGYDDKNSNVLKSFNNEIKYPYFVFIDGNDKLVFKQDTVVTDEEYMGIIAPSFLGKTVGNQVGDICINQNINIIGSNEKFSVLNNKGKVVVINFWYTDCQPCKEELPHFNEVYEEYKDDVSMIIVHEASIYDGDPELITSQILEICKDYSFTLGYDDITNQYFKALGGKNSFPMTVIVDTEGVISFVNQGKVSKEKLVSEIEKLLN